MSPTTPSSSAKDDKMKKKNKKKKPKSKIEREKKLLKEKFIALVRRKLVENAQFRRNFVKANEYNKIAQSIRVCFREDETNEDAEEKEKMLCTDELVLIVHTEITC